ncbi:MAG TPA: hypothetical protein HA257_05230 [Candidatus Methanoperedenaceae archaeon]|nr:hypothetical protein [Candidatus Methanoperedenaceae archaeon]
MLIPRIHTLIIADDIPMRGDMMELSMEVDGKSIPANRFVNDIICNMIAGAVESLRGVDKDWNTVSIRIRK